MNIHALPAIPLLISYVIGISCYQYLTHLSLLGIGLLTLVAFVLLFVLSKLSIVFKHIGRVRSLLLCFAVVALGYCLTYLHDVRNNPSFYQHHINQARQVVLIIKETPVEKNKTFLIPANIIAYKSDSSYNLSRGKVNVYFYKDDSIEDFKVGDTLVLPAKIVPITYNKNPFSFNYAQYFAYQQLYYQGFYAVKDILYKSESNNQPSFIARSRQHFLHILNRNIADTTTKSIITAMLLNERALLHEDIWKSYAQTGIVHIISISGMHIQIFLSILLLALAWIKNNKYRWIKYLVAFIIIWFYIALTLFPPSAVRAGIMFSITALGIVLQKQENSINSLGFAALLMLLIQPYWLFNLGMQLSFLCMLAIFLFYKPIKNLVYFPNKWIRTTWEGIALSLAIQILVAPLVIYYFQQFPLFVFIVNIPAAIFSTIVMWGSIIIMLLGGIINMSWLGAVLAFITKYFNDMVGWIALHTPNALSQFSLDKLGMVLLSLVLLTWAYYALYYRNKKSFSIACLATLLFMVNTLVLFQHMRRQERLVVYQIANQSLVQIIKGNKAVLYTNDSTQAYQKPLNIPQLYWRIQEIQAITQPNASFTIASKSALLLTHAIQDSVAVDMVIMGNNTPYAPSEIAQKIKTKLIILDSSFPRWKAQKYLEERKENDPMIYSVSLQGAYLYPPLE